MGGGVKGRATGSGRKEKQGSSEGGRFRRVRGHCVGKTASGWMPRLAGVEDTWLFKTGWGELEREKVRVLGEKR